MKSIIMKYCQNCLQTNLRPNTTFNKKNLCPVCLYYQSNSNVDWNDRFNILENLIYKYKLNSKYHDCILGVSGGKDSTRQALWLRDKLNLNPLLACLSYPPQQVSKRGTDNISNLINLGFDVVISSPAPGTWKKLVKQSFLKFANWAKSTELALHSFVPQLAIKYNIPLIFWGENPGLQVGDKKTLAKSGYDGKNLKNLNTLQGGDLSWINLKDINKKNLFPYIYPSEEEFFKNKIKIIYLGWFIKDWSLVENAHYSISYGLNIREKKFKNFGDVLRVTSLDEDWVTINQVIKYYKYGFGRTSDYVNEAIRNKQITRSEGIKIVSKYDGKFSAKLVNDFCKYLEISEKKFWEIVISKMNKKLFYLESKKIKPKFKVGIDFYK